MVCSKFSLKAYATHECTHVNAFYGMINKNKNSMHYMKCKDYLRKHVLYCCIFYSCLKLDEYVLTQNKTAFS